MIRFLHPRYHPKIIGDIIKNVQKASALVFMGIYIINGFENEAENGK